MGILVLAKPVHYTHPTVQQRDGEASVAAIPAGLQQEEALPWPDCWNMYSPVA